MKSPNNLILLYYLLYFFGIELNNQTSIYSIRLLLFLPVLIYVIFNIKLLFSSANKPNIINNSVLFILLFYIILHVRTASIKDNSIFYLATHLIILLFHLMFWLIVILKVKSINDFEIICKKILYGLLICFVIVTFIPMNLLGEFSIGGHYNLGDQFSKVSIPFTSSTIESPLLCSITIIITFFLIIYKKQNANNEQLNNAVFGILLFMAVLELLLINRRGPILSLGIAIALFLSRNYFSKTKLIYVFPAIVLLPMVWPIIIDYVLLIFENDFVKMFIARTDVENIMSATGRTYNWLVVLQHISLFQFNNDYLFGIGNLPELEVLGPYGHAHNSILQLFVHVGIIGVLLNTFMIIYTIHAIVEIISNIKNKYIYSIIGIFFLMIALTPSESLFMSVYFTHLLFINLVILLLGAKKMIIEEKKKL